MRLVCIIGLTLVSARATGASGTGDNLPMNFSYNQGKLLGMTDDGLMAYSSLSFGLFAAYQWRHEARISGWIAFAAIVSYLPEYLEHTFSHVSMLTWLDRIAAASLGMVLLDRMRAVPRFYHLAVALLLWATCDILYGNLTRPLYVSLHSLWHVSIWTYVAELPRD